MVNDLPAQIAPLVTDTVGNAFTVTYETAVFVLTQPFASVPVTL